MTEEGNETLKFLYAAGYNFSWWIGSTDQKRYSNTRRAMNLLFEELTGAEQKLFLNAMIATGEGSNMNFYLKEETQKMVLKMRSADQVLKYGGLWMSPGRVVDGFKRYGVKAMVKLKKEASEPEKE